MLQPQLSASPSETAETPTLRILPSPRPLRLDELTPEVAKLICDVIRLDGLADHHAGALASVRRATLERWKAEDEGFALALELARAEFEWKLIQKINNARKADGTPDWRAQVWVLKNYSAEGVVKPVRAAKPAAAAAQKCANLPETPAAPTAPTPGAVRENASNLPETHARPVRSPQAVAPLTGGIAPAGEKSSILPETRCPAGVGKQKAA
ncbi:MAG TPA: hypothetical protein VGO11_16915 [Chthoniobacteraceae bacterium]|jgi:hypothetical protein|nr:hypothetical protein [Chthoniobacteraceae bacterium]